MIRKPAFIYFFLSIVIISTISCNLSGTDEEQAGVYYYPQKNVYFDPASKKYFYSLNGAASWDSMWAKSENPAALGTRIFIEENIATAVKNNANHRNQYNGNLINIPPGDTTLIAQARTVSDKKSFQKPVAKKTEKKDKRTFFQKLFGIKKKK